MATERFDPDRLILTLQHSADPHVDEIAAALAGLAPVDAATAEHLVATAGEDEAAYALRDRPGCLDALLRTINEFLADDEGGFHRMAVHLTSYERSPAVLEIWFHVGSPGGPGGAWIRQLVVGIDFQTVYAAIGPMVAPKSPASPPEGSPQESAS